MTRQVLVIVGTRPEAIKLAPVVLALRAADGGLSPVVCLTGQHPRLAAEALGAFGLGADFVLDCVPPGGDLCTTAAGVVSAIGKLLASRPFAAVIVQGDTLSAMSGGLAACLRRVPVAHVEAGLRSGRMDDPFPEEIARRQLATLARWNFAPTAAAVRCLLSEGIAPASIHRVGNTVIDAMRLVRATLPTDSASDGGPLVLVTAHRRENWGEPMERICAAIRELATRNPHWRFLFSVHPNPQLQALIARELGECPAVERVSSPPYDEWVRRLVSCELVLTDSGGIQEEACALGRPTLVLRETTERPEAVEAGTALLVGTQAHNIIIHAERILGDAGVYAAMAQPRNVFGDGHAAERIAEILCNDRGVTATSNSFHDGVRV